jgi:hypothetical protein
VDTAQAADVDYVDIGAYKDSDDSEPDEGAPPVPKIS